MLTLTTLGVYFWLKQWQKQNSFLFLTISIVCFALVLYLCFPARIFIPLFTLSLFLIEIKTFLAQPAKILITASLVSILIFPLITHIISETGLNRWRQTKGGFNLSRIGNLYFSHFSADFLFFKGDSQFPNQFITRHSVRGIGEPHHLVSNRFFSFLYYLKLLDNYPLYSSDF